MMRLNPGCLLKSFLLYSKPFLDKLIQNRSLWKQRVVNFLVLRSELLDGPGLNENYDLIIDALFGFLVHALVHSMAIRVVEFSNGGYKIRKIFA